MNLLKLYNRDKTFFYFVPLLLLLGACLVHSLSTPYSDYAGYYFGSRELLHGNYRNAYDMQSLNFLIAAEGYKGIFVSPFLSRLSRRLY